MLNVSLSINALLWSSSEGISLKNKHSSPTAPSHPANIRRFYSSFRQEGPKAILNRALGVPTTRLFRVFARITEPKDLLCIYFFLCLFGRDNIRRILVLRRLTSWASLCLNAFLLAAPEFNSSDWSDWILTGM